MKKLNCSPCSQRSGCAGFPPRCSGAQAQRYFNTGFEYTAGDAFDDPTLSMFHRDADSSPKGYRFQLDGAYALVLYGTNFRMRAQGTANDPTFYMAMATDGSSSSRSR
jgi:hypothetical protein